MRINAVWKFAGLAIIAAGCNQTSPPAPVAESQPSMSSDKAVPADRPANNLETDAAPESLASAETAFTSLVAAAKDSDFDSWTSAEQSLTSLGAQAAPVLAKHLSDDDEFARELAVQFLAQLGPDAAAAEKELTQALADSSPMVRVNSAATLLAINVAKERAEAVLRELMTSDDATVRLPAAISLAGNEAAAEDAVAALTALLGEDHDDSIRVPAVQALGRLGDKAKSSLNAIRMLTSVENAALQTAAREAARQIEGGVDETSETIPVGGVEP